METKDKPDTDRDVLAYCKNYGWVVCAHIGGSWIHGWEQSLCVDLPKFDPTDWTEMPDETRIKPRRP